MNKILLYLLRLLSGTWRRFGANPEHLMIIMEAKLKMDGRRRSAFGSMGNQHKKKTKNQDVLSMVLFGFMGLAFMFLLILFENSASGMIIYFTAWMVFVTLTLITDFTDVLIDVRDNYILLPRPVNDRTITLSRLLHIVFYLSKLVLAFVLPAAIAVGVKFGVLGLLIFLFLVMISVVLAILLVNLIYLLILRLTSPRRFKEIIMYFQVIFTSMIFISYYLLPQFIDIEDYKNLNIMDHGMVWFMPSGWLGGFWELAYNQVLSASTIGLSLLTLLAPVASIVLVTNYLAKDFNQKMMGIGMSDGGSKKVKKTEASSISWRDRSAGWFTQSLAERAGYEWTWNITQRSRTYRLKVYPFFAFIPAYFVYLFFQGDGSFSEKFDQLLSGENYIVLFYFCLFLLTTSFQLSKFSEQYKSAWVFYAMPIEKPGPLIMGALKACTVRFFLPFFLLIVFLALFFWGPMVLDDALLAFLNIILICLMIGLTSNRSLPFSQAWENQNKGSNFTQGMLTMMFAGILGSIHYFLGGMHWWVTPILILFSGTLVWIFYQRFYNLAWDRLQE